MHSVAVHVVGQSRGTADARDNNEVLPRDLQLRQEGLERGQDRVVAAARAPADFLVRFEIPGGKLLVRLRHQAQRGEPARAGGVLGAVVRQAAAGRALAGRAARGAAVGGTVTSGTAASGTAASGTAAGRAVIRRTLLRHS